MLGTNTTPKTDEGARMSQPSVTRNRHKFRLLVDLYLEEPAKSFKVYRSDTKIRGVTSCLCVINVGPLHLSLETLRGPRDLGGKADEVFNETASGDG